MSDDWQPVPHCGIGFFNCREHHVSQRDDCPICRIKELEARVDAVKAIVYESKHADIDKLEQIEAALNKE